MAVPLTSMTLADGHDPIDSVYAAASSSVLLDSGTPDQRRTAADARATARFSLDGKAAIITGGYGALGFECGLAMLEHGIRYLGIIDVRRSDEKLSMLRNRGGRTDTCVLDFIVDLSADNAAEQALEFFCKTFPRLDIVLCCAGIVGVEHALDTTAAKWRAMQNTNTTSGFLFAQAAAKQMIAFARGATAHDHEADDEDKTTKQIRCNASIILISSISAHHVNFPQPQAAYNVSKAGVSHLARCLAAEWAVHGIRVNSISPGYMDTALNTGSHLDDAKKVWYGRTPMGRMGRVDEVAGLVVLLGSPAGAFITGADLVVDGGLTVL